MDTVRVEIPCELVKAAGWNGKDLSAEASAVLALELSRQDKVPLGRAAELCDMPVERFMHSAAEHDVPLHYGGAMRTGSHWNGWVCDRCLELVAPDFPGASAGWIRIVEPLGNADDASSEACAGVGAGEAAAISAARRWKPTRLPLLC
ncbi:MAG: UPF0175 family protein [Bryobacterales bacterium]|nr:UPF0175 family protein [Bryobacterales bacterium]